MNGRPPSLWRKLAALLRPWRRSLIAVAGCVIASALVELVPPFVIRHVVNHNLVPRQSGGLVLAGVVYLLAVAADAALSFAYAYLAARVSQAAIATLRVRLFSHSLALPASHFDRTPIADVISRSTADVETVDDLFTDGIATLLGQLVPLIAVAVAMLVLSPLLTGVAAVVMVPLLVITRFLQVRVRDAERDTRLAIGRLNVELAEVVGGVETLRAFGREETFVARFRRALARTLQAQSQSVKYNAFFAPVSGLLAALVIAALLWIGAGGTSAGAGVDLGTLTAFVLLFQNFFAPIVALGDQWQSVQAAIAGAERVFELLDLPPDSTPAEQAPVHAGGGIQVAHVRFGYEPNRLVLDDVSLTVQPGEHLALVGRTGAGKSTLVSLIGGLYTPSSGRIRVNGHNPRLLADDERRTSLGVAPQSLQLFGATVRDNLTLFDPAIGDDAIERAVELAGIDTLLAQLPDQLDTPLAGQGRGGGTVLSAGQRQLLALARTLVCEPAVLLLDEATAAVDGASDAAFRNALRATALERGCAVLTVAHRIASARRADRVVVLDDGRIVEAGPPEQLLAAGGRFAALAELEAAGWDWQDNPHTQERNR
ncbi:MAG TPA: ABC transporter ATP-binding protein [Gaiellaceae bacterium]|nr:ABC transporter ATP-binding protein [Gaiellaceae bacterium]